MLWCQTQIRVKRLVISDDEVGMALVFEEYLGELPSYDGPLLDFNAGFYNFSNLGDV